MKTSETHSTHHKSSYFTTEHLESGLRKHAVRGAGATVVCQVSIYCIQMISTIILARLLSPHDFGLVAMVIYIFLFFKMLRNLGLIDATIQRDEITHAQLSTLFWINVLFSIGIALIFVALSPLIVWFYKEPQLEEISVSISLVFILGGLSTQHLALLKRNMQFYRSAANEIIATIIGVITAIILAVVGCGYWALVWKHVASAGAEAVGAWIICRWRPTLPSYGTGVSPMLRFGVNMLGNFSVNYFSQNLDKVLVGWRNGPQSLGHYDKAYQLFLAPAQQLSYPLTHVVVATLSRLNNDPEKYRSYYLSAVSLLSFVAFPLSAALAVMGKDIILLLLGPQWGKAGDIFSIFALGIGIHVLYGTHGWLHISLGRTDRWFRWGIVGASVSVTSFLIGLPFGPPGVAVAYTIAIYILTGPGLWYAGKPIGISLTSIVLVSWKYFVAALGAGSVAWYILFVFDVTSASFSAFDIVVRLCLSLALCVSIYLTLIIALYGNTKPISHFFTVLYDMVPRLSLKD